MNKMLRSPTTPGEILKEEFLVPMGTTQGELASHLDCDVKVINRIVNGRVGVSAEMALKLAAAFNTTPEFWLNAQKEVDLYNAAKKDQTFAEATKKPVEMEKLERFIVRAKANGWVSAQPGGKKISPSKLGSLDVTFEEGDFFYQDSFVGLTDFCGQEHVCLKGEAVWSQAYYGFLTRPDLFDGRRTVEVLRAALGSMYGQGRFLGGFEFQHQQCTYRDSNKGNYENFQGEELRSENRVLLKFFESRYA